MTNIPMPSHSADLTSETKTAELVNDFAWDGNQLEPGLAIALSGGGFRAMLFHAGALTRLNKLGLLSKVARISSVSGGSISAGLLAAVWTEFRCDSAGVFANFKETYVTPLLSFSRQNLDLKCVLKGLLPWTSAAAQVAKTYERFLYSTRTLQDIPDMPRFVFCAANLQTGVLWRFSKPYAGDYIVGRLASPRISLSRAVAASSAFPPFLSPMELFFTTESFTDWPASTRHLLSAKELQSFRKEVYLTDGGVYDNHGLEPVLKRYMTIFVSDGGAPFGRSSAIGWDWVRQLRRILDITDNQVRALRRRDLIARLRAGNTAFATAQLQATETRAYDRLGAYWGIDTDPGSVEPAGALPCSADATKHLAHVSTRLADLGAQTGKQLVNWGYAICDRCLRKHYVGPIVLRDQPPEWPFLEAPL